MFGISCNLVILLLSLLSHNSILNTDAIAPVNNDNSDPQGTYDFDQYYYLPKPKPTPKPQSNQERNPYGLNQDFDIFDAIKGHLLDEGYAETEDAAIAIMANMGEEWRNSILEQSAIASRTAKVVDDQRQGYHGDFDAINKLQNATSKSIGRLKRGQGPVVTPGLPGV